MKRILPIAVIFLVAATGCTLTGTTATEEAGLPTIAPPTTVPTFDLSGNWTGELADPNTRDVLLHLEHDPQSRMLQGTITITSLAMVEFYEVVGTFDGLTLRFATEHDLYFTGTFTPTRLEGYFAWSGYDDPDSKLGTFLLYPEGQEPTPTRLPPPTVELGGTWNGTLTETEGGLRTFNMQLVLLHEPGSNDFTANVDFTLDGNSNFLETYLVYGTVSGNSLQFQESAGGEAIHFFWATVEGDSMEGQVSFFCFECEEAYASFTLER